MGGTAFFQSLPLPLDCNPLLRLSALNLSLSDMSRMGNSKAGSVMVSSSLLSCPEPSDSLDPSSPATSLRADSEHRCAADPLPCDALLSVRSLRCSSSRAGPVARMR